MTAEPMEDELDPKFNKPFVEHLEDLRKMLFAIAGLLLAGLLVAIPFAPHVIALAKAPMAKAGKDPEQFLQVIQVAGGFVLGMKIIFWTGILFSSPFILICIARFVFPGLKAKERRLVRAVLWASVLLFAAGVFACYKVTLPVGIAMMFSMNSWLGVNVEWVEFGDYVSFVLKLLIAFGAAFELPVVVLTLGFMGIISSRMLRTYRRHAIVVILIIAMVLTPPDVFTQLLMGVPMILLYEICVWTIYLRERRAKQRE
jgi:sec-independent protein translocase protein TatC